jgi:hypothetical protein
MWKRPEVISRSTVVASHPYIECFEDTLSIAWDGKDRSGVPDQIWILKKPAQGRKWLSAVRIDTSNKAESRFPAVSNGSSIIWVESAPHGNMFCSLLDSGAWRGPIALGSGGRNSGYPHVVFYTSAPKRYLFVS